MARWNWQSASYDFTAQGDGTYAAQGTVNIETGHSLQRVICEGGPQVSAWREGPERMAPHYIAPSIEWQLTLVASDGSGWARRYTWRHFIAQPQVSSVFDGGALYGYVSWTSDAAWWDIDVWARRRIQGSGGQLTLVAVGSPTPGPTGRLVLMPARVVGAYWMKVLTTSPGVARTAPDEES